MFFPISGAHISPIYLVIVGFLIGILGGFFGVGGSFIAGPALRLVGLDWNFAVGTDLAHIVGKSVVAAKRHRALGNVDLRLGSIMAIGTIAGAEAGAQLIQMLKRAGNLNLIVSIVAIVVYLSISAFMLWQSQNKRSNREAGQIGLRTHDTCDPAAEDLADDCSSHIRRESDFALDDSPGCVRWRSVRGLSRRRCWLHPDAVDGLCAWDSHSPG